MAIRTRTRPREGRSNVSQQKQRPAAPTKLSVLLAKINGFDLPSVDVVKRAAWICLLLVCYVFFQNRYDKLTYETARAKREMDEKSAIYISKKESYSLQSKQSEISKRLEYRGLDKSLSPPIKIEAEN